MDLLTYYSDLAVAYPEYITQKQFCEVCGICHKTAYNLTRRGEISYEIVDWTVERLEQRFAAEDAQISVFLSSGKDGTMTEKQKQECSELETMLQGTPKQNVLISFDGKPPKTLEELEKEQQRRKKKHKDRGEAR